MSSTEPVAQIHIPKPDNVPKRRKKMMFFDRSKVILLLGAYLALAISADHGETPLTSWAEAANNQIRAKWVVLLMAGVELVRQTHYLISEKSAKYNFFWTQIFFGSWERFWGKRNPWLRFRLGRAFRFAIGICTVNAILAHTWHKPFFYNLTYTPSRLLNILFTTAQGLPLIFVILMEMMLSVGTYGFFMFAASRGGIDVLAPDEVDVRFSDVWGQDKVVERVKEVVGFLENPAAIESKGGYVPGGILLYGPPGTGKTLIAKAVAGETGKPFVFVDPGAFQAAFMGVGILKVKLLYRRLRKLALRHGGVIVFFDEADHLGNRGSAVASFEPPTHAHSVGGTCNGMHYVSPYARQLIASHLNPAPEPTEEPGEVSKTGRVRNFIIAGGGGGGGMGTLQALLTEISGLEKPRGFFSRRIRKFLCMPGKKPPKYRILMVMATNLPNALDAALLRPGRIDRIFMVDWPTLDGRIKTYEGYLQKVKNTISPENIRRLAVSSQRQSGATIKDIVNEALIVALRDKRDIVDWPDLIKARELKLHGLSDGVHSVTLERHMVALHEAGHASAMKLLKKRYFIDIATIERRGAVGGFVMSVPMEEEIVEWRFDMEHEVMTFLASLASERHFFDGDNSLGVGGDMRGWTSLVTLMISGAAMGTTLANQHRRGFGGSDAMLASFDEQLEGRLQVLFERTCELIEENEAFVLGIAHALEQFHTITGEDIDAIYEGTKGPIVDGAWYKTADFLTSYKAYHATAVSAHRNQTKFVAPLPTHIAPTALVAAIESGDQVATA